MKCALKKGARKSTTPARHGYNRIIDSLPALRQKALAKEICRDVVEISKEVRPTDLEVTTLTGAGR